MRRNSQDDEIRALERVVGRGEGLQAALSLVAAYIRRGDANREDVRHLLKLLGGADETAWIVYMTDVAQINGYTVSALEGATIHFDEESAWRRAAWIATDRLHGARHVHCIDLFHEGRYREILDIYNEARDMNPEGYREVGVWVSAIDPQRDEAAQ